MVLISNQTNTHSVAGFNYKILSRQQRAVILQYTGEIKERLRRTAQDVWEVGQKLTEVRSQLEHGQFEGWLSAEFGWSRRTAYNFINVYEAFSETTNFNQLDIATSALYKLAAPSTPKSIRHEFLAKAQQGEKITHRVISQALTASKNSNIVKKSQAISKSSQKVLQIIPKVRESPKVPEVNTALIEKLESSSSSKGIATPTQMEIKSGYWYLFNENNFLFCGDTALPEFYHRSQEATLALAITSNDWDHDWLIETAHNLIVLPESSLRNGLIEQIISLLSAEGDTIILPWLPDQELLAIASNLNRKIVAGDPSPERCQKAISKVGFCVKELNFQKLA